MGVYPRVDSNFRTKHSYNFDMMKTEVFMTREVQSSAWMWLAYFFVGLCVGIVAFIMEIFEKRLVGLRDMLSTRVLEATDNS